MRKILLAVAGAAVLAAGAGGVAIAQSEGQQGGERRHGIFQSDANTDGVLTRAEFDTGREGMFTRLDADNNGELTREEMRAHRGERGHRGMRGHRRGGGMHLSGADANNDGNITREEFLARPTAMFERLDANDDGVIQASERPQRGERRERRADRPDRPNRDSYGDGAFSRSEFTAMGARMFERLDANSDGRVTQDEAQAAHGRHRGRR